MIKNSGINDYLLSRGITQDVLSEHKIGWNGHNIVIPVFFSTPGTRVIFNKYRRDPAREDGPKYTYDKGSYAALYNQGCLQHKDKPVFIVEGEFDALLLISKGFNAVSSTGGASTFQPDWVEKFHDIEDIYILYDNDRPGVRGAAHVQSLIPRAKIIWLPEEMEGKDVTDFFGSYTLEDFNTLVTHAKSYLIPQEPEQLPTKKTALQKLKRDYNALADKYLEEYNESIRLSYDSYHWQYMEEYVRERANKIRILDKYVYESKDSKVFSSRLERAREVPIELWYNNFNNNNKSSCLWHKDPTPSLHLYREPNHLYCFGGCGKKDVIDLVQKLENVNFNEAVRILLNE